MTLDELESLLLARDIRLSLRLVVDSPRGALTAEARAALAAHKPALLARLARCQVPRPVIPWEILAACRWGPARGDPSPGIVIDRPNPARMLAVLRKAAGDPQTVVERHQPRTEEWSDPVDGQKLARTCRGFSVFERNRAR